jgi:hypothetical protein
MILNVRYHKNDEEKIRDRPPEEFSGIAIIDKVVQQWPVQKGKGQEAGGDVKVFINLSY